MGKNKKAGGRSHKEDSKETGLVQEVVGTIIYLVVVVLITLLFVKYVAQRTVVHGSSMESTLSDNDNLIVEKVTYRFHEPERFDIIVFPYKYKKNTNYIKRIIGLPGETVQITEEGDIYINGEILNESYGLEVIRDNGIASDPIKLGENEYFVLGDNRNNSSDSRDPSVGVLNGDDFIGRAVFRMWPLNHIGKLE